MEPSGTLQTDQVQSVRFVIPSLPPSVNSLYNVLFNLRRIELKPEVRSWKTKAKEFVPKAKWISETKFLKIDMVLRYNFYFKNGKLREVDSQNMLKVLCDCVAEKNGISDKGFKSGSWDSVHDMEKESVEVTLSKHA